MSMSSLTGKRILSLVRDGDFAHAGETEAVDLVLDGMPREASRRVLDLGCGLGATAALIAARGHGQVTGIDIDAGTIEYASRTYPGVSFRCAGASEVSSAVTGPFDTIVMFNAFYAFPDQATTLRECRSLAAPDGELRLFDYTTPAWNDAARDFCTGYARGGHWRPLALDTIKDEFAAQGWRVESVRILDDDYRRWYRTLVATIDARRDRIIAASNQEWFEYARWRFTALLAAIESGVIGGAIVRAVTIHR
jgi:cyclopropane fatty-acyl-phospholipid synthase-like methyltransferase